MTISGEWFCVQYQESTRLLNAPLLIHLVTFVSCVQSHVVQGRSSSQGQSGGVAWQDLHPE